jgi:peroxiredoxin
MFMVMTAVVERPARGDEPLKPTPSASAANPAVPAPGHSIHGEAFNEGPRHQASLLPGMGKAQFPVTTSSPQAQAFVNQGVGQLHSFYYLESERSFRQAALLDPNCAMAYWGMAMSNVNNAKRAKPFLAEARKRDAKLSRREKLYIDALEAFYKEGDNEKSRRQNWLLGLETVVQEFPDDIDARAWLAMVTWQNGSKDGIGSRQAVDTVIESVIQNEPMHPGAYHYRIHLWDGVKPARAEKAAALYAGTAPGIAHAWHMPGHTYTGLKRYADAAYQQEGSARVDHAAMARDRTMPFEIHNYAHNNQWFCTSASHIGRVHDAVAVARNLVEQPRDPQQNGPNDGGSPQRSGRIRWAEILTRYELWDDLIAATTSGALDWSDIPVERVQKAYSLGLAYAAKNDTAKLGEQIDMLKKLADEAAKKGTKKEGGAKYSWDAGGVNPQSALAELEGYRHLARGEVGPAFEQFAKAPGMRAEALARAHLAARNFGFAESIARKAVDDNPNQVPPLTALVEILAAVGKEKDAREAYRKLVPLAKQADRDVPMFTRLDAIVARWKQQDPAWADSLARNGEATANGSDEAAITRIDLATLGPLIWSPTPAEPFALVDTAGASWSLADRRGKSVLAIFYLGGKCAHCMQQLATFGKEVDALKSLGVEVIAIGTDDTEATRALKENKDGVKFPMPLLADPKLDVFKKYRAFDDFENQPLHGTFLIDARGDVRFQRISSNPFLEVEFIKKEAARVGKLTAGK